MGWGANGFPKGGQVRLPSEGAVRRGEASRETERWSRDAVFSSLTAERVLQHCRRWSVELRSGGEAHGREGAMKD